MAKNDCAIAVVHDQGWAVRYNGRDFGPFPDEETARDAAIAAGAKAASLGLNAEVSLGPERRR